MLGLGIPALQYNVTTTREWSHSVCSCIFNHCAHLLSPLCEPASEALGRGICMPLLTNVLLCLQMMKEREKEITDDEAEEEEETDKKDDEEAKKVNRY